MPVHFRFDRRLISLGLLPVLLAALIAFWPATHGPFVFDDFPNLENLAQLEGTPDLPHLRRYLAAFNGNPGRPLAALSFVIEDAAWPTDPAPYKRNNLLWHLLAGVLLFALTRQLAGLHSSTVPWRAPIALATTAMWLLHPLQLSATMLVVQRMNILATIFIVLGLLAYLACLARQDWSPFRRVATAGVSLAAFAVIAILCKENGILVFAYAGALNLTLLRPRVMALTPRMRWLLHAGCALPLLLLALAGVANHAAIAYDYRFRDFTLVERLLTESRILVDYLRAILLPRIGTQGVFHDHYPISRGLLDPPTTLLAIALLAAMAAMAWRWRIRAPLFAFAVFWFLAGHLLESTVWPLELYFEHRNYLPMFGALFAIASAVALAPAAYRRGSWLLLSLWLLLVAGLTALNARTWGDRETLARVWLEQSPTSVRAIQMVASQQADSGHPEAAKRTLLDGLARVPAAGELAMQIALLDCVTTGVTRPQFDALVELGRTIRNSRMVPETVARFGKEQRGGRCQGTLQPGDFQRLAQAVMANPAIAWQTDAIGYLQYELSQQALHDRNLDQLMHYMDESNRLRPNPLVSREQAIYLLSAGLPREAMLYLEKSEQTPQPWIKAKLLDIPAMNAPLWRSARQMQQALAQPAHSKDARTD